jgi:hypothetical protein
MIDVIINSKFKIFMKKQIFTLLSITAIVLLIPAITHATGSVGSGREIDWDSSTSYTDERDWANSQWNALGKVAIVKDGLFTLLDLSWKDDNRPTESWDGKWDPALSPNVITLNIGHLKSETLFQRRAVATHELGHALGLFDSTYYRQVMYHMSAFSGVNTPQDRDKDEYNSLWK